MNKISLTVGIAAYNAEKNIERLTQTLLTQKEDGYTLKNIIVHSDKSTYKTIEILKTLKNKRLFIKNSPERLGFAGVVKNLISKNTSDLLLVLNDDIIIKDQLFLAKLVLSYQRNNNIGLLCANPVPLKSTKFISEAVRSGYKVYKKLGDNINHGNNIFTVDGKALFLSKEFMRNINFPKDLSKMATVDKYLYLLCKKMKFSYCYAKDSIMYFKCPSSVNDFVKWQIRNHQTNNHFMFKEFPNLAEKEYRIPQIKFQYYKLVEFIKNPLGSIFILLLGFYTTYMSTKGNQIFNKKWDLVLSTKDI
jgi:cellulose synthase/poly-beta-1,6-N-acetylglucosamine synthase-like glycosyltransferase